MGKVQTTLCFGLAYSSSSGECLQCSLSSLCSEVVKGVIGWEIAYSLISSTKAHTQQQVEEKRMLLEHIKKRIESSIGVIRQNTSGKASERSVNLNKGEVHQIVQEVGITPEVKEITEKFAKYLGDVVKIVPYIPRNKQVMYFVRYTSGYSTYLSFSERGLTVTVGHYRGASLFRGSLEECLEFAKRLINKNNAN